MFFRVIISSLLLAAFVNGLAIRRDDGYYSSSSFSTLSLPSVTPQPILLPVPSVSLSLPPLDPNPTSTPIPSLSSSSLSPSVVTTTVYVYPTQCSPTPTTGPSGVPNSDLGTQPTPITLPQASPLNLHPVRRGDLGSVMTQEQTANIEVQNLQGGGTHGQDSGTLGVAPNLNAQNWIESS